MQLLLVAATEMEISPFLKERPSADFLITGVGCPAAIYHLTKRLHQIDYDLVIQAGIGGSFTNSINLGDVVIVNKDTFADLGISEKNKLYTIFEKGFADMNSFPFSEGLLKNNDKIIDHFSLEKVSAVTVNTITDGEMQREQFISKFDPQIESMEGAALHYVCLNEHVPFMQLRSVSNYVGERDKAKWKMKEAIDNLNEKLIEIITELTNEKPINK